MNGSVILAIALLSTFVLVLLVYLVYFYWITSKQASY